MKQLTEDEWHSDDSTLLFVGISAFLVLRRCHLLRLLRIDNIYIYVMWRGVLEMKGSDQGQVYIDSS